MRIESADVRRAIAWSLGRAQIRRAHLFEFHDLAWFPASARDALTDFMSWFAVTFRVFAPVVPILRDAVECAGAVRIIDLCSGAGGPAVAISRALEGLSGGVPMTLTDKYPNAVAFRRAVAVGGAAMSFVDTPVDATDVPSELRGFRTLFTSFHHFAPEAARQLLRDAVEKREGIGIFEYTERNLWLWAPSLALTPLFMLLAMPFVRPFRWSHIAWTLVPPFAAAAVWDGIASCLRTYTPDELLAMAQEVAGGSYMWKSAKVRAFGACRVTYLVGWPSDAAIRTGREETPGRRPGSPT